MKTVIPECLVVLLIFLGSLQNTPAVNPPGSSNPATGPWPELQAVSQAGVHVTRAHPQAALEFPTPSEMTTPVEPFSPGPPTRSSFMPSWNSITGAKGYLLDVSTSPSFDSYVEGYHDLDVGNATGTVVTGLNPGTTYYYRVRAYNGTGIGDYSAGMTGTTEPTTGLIIRATFDTSITHSPNAAAIEAMINRAISIYEARFGDPITIHIRFRYATTLPNGTPLPPGALATSLSVLYIEPWNTIINALRADAKTSNDFLANLSLPGSALSPSIIIKSANGRALGGPTAPAMFANGTVGQGGPYDGIVTLNSASPFQFTRPTSASNFDAQRTTEHEMDEVMGLGSRLGHPGNNLRPQDLFSWSSAGHRNITASGTRYFSINGGSTHIVNFNQTAPGDFGDWFSTGCPQAHPFVQNAFSCRGQRSDVTATSPEGVNLDVIGYDLR
jgi:fibronectin type III domain protein